MDFTETVQPDRALVDFLARNNEKIATIEEVDRIRALAQELVPGDGWLRPDNLADQIARRWQIPFGSESATTYKILNSRRGSDFALGDCVFPAAIFVAARESQGLETRMFCHVIAHHPYLVAADGKKFWEVDFVDTIKSLGVVFGRANMRSGRYIRASFTKNREMREYPDLLSMLRDFDVWKMRNKIAGE